MPINILTNSAAVMAYPALIKVRNSARKMIIGNMAISPKPQLNKEVDKESFKGTERIDPGRLEQALINRRCR